MLCNILMKTAVQIVKKTNFGLSRLHNDLFGNKELLTFSMSIRDQ